MTTATEQDVYLTPDELQLMLALDTPSGVLRHTFTAETVDESIEREEWPAELACEDGCPACAYNDMLDATVGTGRPMTQRAFAVCGYKHKNPDDIILDLEPTDHEHVWHIITTDKGERWLVSHPPGTTGRGRTRRDGSTAWAFTVA